MRRFLTSLLLLPALAGQTLMAQAPAPKAPSSTPAPKPVAPKPATPQAAAPRPAGPRATPAARPAAASAPMTDEQKTIYALGLLMQRSLTQFDLSPAELDIVKRALTDATRGKPAVDIDEWGPNLEPFAGARRARVATREKAVSAQYLVKAAAEAGAIKTETGLVYRDVSPGTGASPTASDTVKVHYRGTLVNGTVFDSSYDRNEPAVFGLAGVVKCWTEGVQRMKVGGKARLVCPSDLAYGDGGNQAIPGGAALVFEIELLEIIAP